MNSIASTSTPAVLLLVFNRPDYFRQLIDALSMARPIRVYIAADGPRAGNTSDQEKCAQTRELIKLIDWPAQIYTRLLDENFGCAKAVSSAITWFFEHEPEGIILEDDCIPGSDFFRYCAQMLELYRERDEVMHISGSNLGAPAVVFGQEYHGFSSLPQIWGWATWRRAWVYYRLDLKESEIPSSFAFRRRGIALPHAHAMRKTFIKVARGRIKTWDYQWVMWILVRNGICIIPRENLVKNIGFGADSSHTSDINSPLANITVGRFCNNDYGAPDRFTENKALNNFLVTINFGPQRRLFLKFAKDLIRGRL